MGNIGRALLLLETLAEFSVTPIPRIHTAVLGGIRVMDENVAKEWSLPDLAKRLDLDPSYVARLFTSGIGAPPLAYLALLRAEEAASLLANSNIPCNEVGERVGWTDPNYFSRRFKQHFEESPTSFRARSQQVVKS
jgi:AraC family L-rhamnose operon transcriptional activator RhaR